MLVIYFVFLLSQYGDLSVLDQRQVGDFNVQVDVKDVQIFAMMKGDKEEYVDYDYAYDYSEFTIKPQNRTTPKPFNGMKTSTQRITTINGTITEAIKDNSTASHTDEFISTTSSDYLSNTTIKQLSDENSTQAKETKSTIVPTLNTTVKNCKRGFILNQKGECQLKINSNGNALLKLVKLSHKLKLRRENKSNHNP
ncbi:unnamed protein product, partial [Brenthis ino]